MSVIRLDSASSPPARRSRGVRDDDWPGTLLDALMRATDAERVRQAVSTEATDWLGARTCELYLADESHSTTTTLPDCVRSILVDGPMDDAVAQPPAEIEAGETYLCAPLQVDGAERAAGALYCRFDAADPAAVALRRDRIARILPPIERALENVREFEALHESLQRLQQAERLQRALYAIADLATSDRDMPNMLRGLHEIVAGLMYAENLFIVIYDRRTETVRFPYCVDTADSGLTDPDTDYSLREWVGSLTWHLLTRGHPLMGSTEQLQAQIGEPLPPFGADCVEWLGVPLMRGDEVVGGIVVQSYEEEHRFSESDRVLLTYVAQHILTALDRKQAHSRLESHVAERTDALREANHVLQRQVDERKRGERLQAALFRIAELTSTLSTDAFHAAMHRVIGSLLYAENFFIALVSDDQETLTFAYSADEFDQHRATRKCGRGLTEMVLRSGKPLLVNRDDIDRLKATGKVVASGTRAMCWLGVPLICEDRTVGVLAVQSYSEEQRYTLRDQALLTFVSYHVANALQRKQNADSICEAKAQLERRVESRTTELANTNRELYAEIRRREQVEQQLKNAALHDSLTRLPNRTLFLDRLSQVLAEYQSDPRKLFAVLFLDLDRFKVINDSVGHLVGDQLLKEVSRRLASTLGPGDMVARLGGDEFAVLLAGIRHADNHPALNAAARAEQLITVLDAPVTVGGKDLFTSASIGIALAAPHYRNPEELLRDADAAMYLAKAEGRRRFALFDQRLHRDAVNLLDLESDLRQALAQHEFEPWFQPIRHLETGRIAGYEALIRWRHPQRGLLKPADFFLAAESAGLDDLIEWQMLDKVCGAVRMVADGDCFVAINLGGQHFKNGQLASRLLGLFDSNGIDPTQMRIEVTEHVLLENSAQAQEILALLREAGVGVVLDDFGTGYSSLSYLRQFPVQALKIDHSFVAELGDASQSNYAVVRAILALAASLDMDTIAEGIENQTQHDRLVALGCSLGQGYLLGRPQPVATLARNDDP